MSITLKLVYYIDACRKLIGSVFLRSIEKDIRVKGKFLGIPVLEFFIPTYPPISISKKRMYICKKEILRIRN